jgi:acid phosphatase (class A)
MKRKFIAYLLSASLLLTGVMVPTFASEAKKPAPIADLTLMVGPPPSQDSDQTKAELKEIKHYQDTRTKEQEAYAKADMDKNIFRFQNVMGDKFTAENLPLTAALFDKAVKVAKDTMDPVKDLYKRPRPYDYDPTVKPCVGLEKSFSYPSGHATAGTMMAILLANMVPEKKEAILKRGGEFALNRVIGGVHYRSDIEEGRITGSVIAELLLKDKKFAKEFAAAKAELRTALGY